MGTTNLYLRLLLCCYCCLGSHGWSEGPKLPRRQQQRTTKPWNVAAAAVIGGFAFFAPISNHHFPLAPPDAIAIESPLSMDEQQLRKSLKPPTADRPQIVLPTRDSDVPIEKQPIVEGLISLSNPQRRPVPTDTIVITFRSFDQPDTILGGARIPATKAKFPLAFRMFPRNLLKDQTDKWETAKQGDLLVQAVLCPEDMPKCTPTEGGRMQAEGVAKLIRNLPGQLEGQTIRGPVALPLQ